jgi:CrcB protein
MRTEALIFVAVGIGSAIGGLARYALSGLVARSFGETFPWGTLVVNVLGSLLSLAQDGEWLRASANVGLSVAACLVAVWLGALLGAWVNR